MTERTFAMIKPDAVAAGYTEDIIKIIEKNGFKIVGRQQINMSQDQAHKLYAVHKDRSFFPEMVSFITSGPLVVMALEKNNAIKDWRTLMGATNPAQADAGTIRKQFGTSIGNNAVHGSDAPQTAREELAIFFPDVK